MLTEACIRYFAETANGNQRDSALAEFCKLTREDTHVWFVPYHREVQERCKKNGYAPSKQDNECYSENSRVIHCPSDHEYQFMSIYNQWSKLTHGTCKKFREMVIGAMLGDIRRVKQAKLQEDVASEESKLKKDLRDLEQITARVAMMESTLHALNGCIDTLTVAVRDADRRDAPQTEGIVIGSVARAVAAYLMEFDDDANQALHYAAQQSDQEVCEALIAVAGATDVDSGLIAAAHAGDVSMCEFFVRKGANDAKMATIQAMLRREYDVLEYLFATFPNVSEYLCWCAVADVDSDVSLCKWIHSKGHMDFEVALSSAAFAGNLEMCKLCLELGAKDVGSSLKVAAHKGHRDVCEYLMEARAVQCCPCVIQACVDTGRVDLLKYFVKSWDINLSDVVDDETGLICAISMGHADMVRHCIQQIGFRSSMSLNFVMGVAAANGQSDVCKTVLTLSNGVTLDLDYAIVLGFKSGHTSVVDELAKRRPLDADLLDAMFVSAVSAGFIKPCVGLYETRPEVVTGSNLPVMIQCARMSGNSAMLKWVKQHVKGRRRFNVQAWNACVRTIILTEKVTNAVCQAMYTHELGSSNGKRVNRRR